MPTLANDLVGWKTMTQRRAGLAWSVEFERKVSGEEVRNFRTAWFCFWLGIKCQIWELFEKWDCRVYDFGDSDGFAVILEVPLMACEDSRYDVLSHYLPRSWQISWLLCWKRSRMFFAIIYCRELVAFKVFSWRDSGRKCIDHKHADGVFSVCPYVYH